MVVPIDLTGVTATTMSGTLDCEPLACIGGTHPQKRAWWASKRGGEQDKLTDFRVRFGAGTLADAAVVDDNGNPVDLTQYPNRLVKGTYHAWMKNGSTQINAIRAHIKVSAQFQAYDVVGSSNSETDTNGNVIEKPNTHELHVHVTLTNSPAGVTTYNGTNISQSAEAPATGLAQNIYTSRQMLDYDGSHLIVDPGSTTHIPLAQILGPWNLVNFSGGNPAWANANMTIAGTEIDLIHNTQRIDIGPNKHLSPQDFNTLLQFFRQRLVLMYAGQRATGYNDLSSNVDMARNTPDANSVGGLQVGSQLAQVAYTNSSDPTSAVVGTINSDASIINTILSATTPTAVVDLTSMKTMQPREVAVCDNSGSSYFVIVHATGGHTKP
jgi:hypothetical protein